MGNTRRPIKSRSAGWAVTFARFLKDRGITPNEISGASVLFAGAAALCLSLLAGDPMHNVQGAIALAAAAVFIQLRLICNLLDGLVAVEGGLRTSAGEIFNDLPDRISDSFILIALGFAAHRYPCGETMGWLVALLAMLTAYVRVLGASASAGHFFCGPMAKQHRMAVVTIACLLSLFEVTLSGNGLILYLALWIIAAGCTVTIVRRLILIIRELNKNV